MKIVNRGYISIKPKAGFANWANEFDLDEFMDIEMIDANIYLVEDDFIEDEALIEQNFKKIFKIELAQITENEEDWPEKLSRVLFNQWFDCEVGTSVFDLHKSDLKAFKD